MLAFVAAALLVSHAEQVRSQTPEPTFGGSRKVSSFYSDGGEKKDGSSPTASPQVCRPTGIVPKRANESEPSEVRGGSSDFKLVGHLAESLTSHRRLPVVGERQSEPIPPQLRTVGFEAPNTTVNLRPCSCGPRIDWRDDLRSFWPDAWDDAKSIANLNNGLILGMGLAAAIGMRQGLDQDVRTSVARNPERWGNTSNVLGRFGDVQYQLPILGAIYGYSLLEQDEELHEFSKSMFSAYAITGLSTVAIKGIANTDRPTDDWNGGMFGFPSFHTASSFTMAAVADEYYGPRVGIPAYVVAGLIGWSRIDERDHDLSDVVFGAALGFVIGKAVAGRHLRGDSRVKILPFVDPIQGGGGVLFDFEY
ncbi:MAG: phosphatase PAP2 family protein [Planctomycetota bacterium]|nr:phosphatase PAP2 family protein [Planctomycetota bacterium]